MSDEDSSDIRKIEHENTDRGWSITDWGEDTVEVELWYPKLHPVKFVQVGLMDVRATDNIRISYDYDRDGWKIGQASDDPDDWQEVAFVQAFGRNNEDGS